MNFFTNFGTEKGPDVGYPANQGMSGGAKPVWVGEMDPSVQHPMDLNRNLVDEPVTQNTVWGEQMYSQQFCSNLL